MFLKGIKVTFFCAIISYFSSINVKGMSDLSFIVSLKIYVFLTKKNFYLFIYVHGIMQSCYLH